jgi:hypothetical protein
LNHAVQTGIKAGLFTTDYGQWLGMERTTAGKYEVAEEMI